LKRWLLPCFLAVVSSIWLVWAFPRLHPAARLGLTMDRNGYIERSRAFATSNGLNTNGWIGQAKVETQTKQQMAREKLATDEIAQTFPSASVSVTLLARSGSESVEMTLRPDGRLLSWSFPVPKTALPGDPKALAESALRELVGDDESKYHSVSEGTQEEGASVFAWERTETTPDPPSVRVEVHVQNGRVKSADTKFNIPDGLKDRLDKFPLPEVVSGFIWFTLLLTAVVVTILREGSANAARSIKDRSAMWIAAAVPVMFLISAAVDWEWEDGGFKVSNLVVTGLALVLGACFLGLAFYALMVATVLTARLHPMRVRGLRLLPGKGFFSRLVGAEILGGLLCAPALVSVPLAISAIFRLPAHHGYEDTLLLSRLPVLDAFASLPNQEALLDLAFLGVLIPTALRFKRKVLRWIVIGVAAITTVAMVVSPFRENLPVDALVVVLSAALVVWFYARFGVLGAITGFCASRVIVAAGGLMVQPAAGLQFSGAVMLAVLGGGAAYAFIAAWKAPEITTQLFGESGLIADRRTRREELLAEFNVARSAQQQMLPARPPDLPGYTIAAKCEPAREVGGDLYDFLYLYMTLTKGLLCAASQDSNDPHQILSSVNTHLREAVRKKMFVTMALGVLDIEARTLEHVRAGHNPIVWRRTTAGETRMLTTAGMALGMTGPTLFSKTLASETIHLETGDALVFYSDGLTEAMNQSEEQFGDDRLMAAVERADGLHAAATRDSILSEVKEFLHGGQSQDDLTLAVVRVSDGR
jgi:hypothetical protein